MQEKYGRDGENDSETDYSSEDSDAEFATAAVDVAILKTLQKIRQGDASIYDSERAIFEGRSEVHQSVQSASHALMLEEEGQLSGNAPASKRAKQRAPLKLKDFQRQQILAGGDDEELNRALAFRTPAQDTEDLRKETLEAFHAPAENEEGDDLLHLRRRTTEELKREEDEYSQFLREHGDLGQTGNSDDAEEVFLKEYVFLHNCCAL